MAAQDLELFLSTDDNEKCHGAASGGFSESLIRRIRSIKSTRAVIDWHCRDSLIANLHFLYDAVVASEQLLAQAIHFTSLLAPSAFRERLRSYYSTHLQEERGHCAWLAEDLAANGVAPIRRDSTAMSMVGTQYYLIKHVHPVALLGYLAAVEGDPVPLHVVRLMESVYGSSLLRFVRIHAVKDQEHRLELFSVLDETPAALHTLIEESADNVLGHLTRAVGQWRERDES